MKPFAVLALAGALAGCAGEADRGRDEGRRLTLYTHCGVLSATVDGELWLADPPLGEHSAPSGWDENSERGTWREVSPGRAEFRTRSGEMASFAVAPPGARDPAEGCE